jgi:hypothetical protein
MPITVQRQRQLEEILAHLWSLSEGTWLHVVEAIRIDLEGTDEFVGLLDGV